MVKMGRPPLPKRKRRSRVLQIRFTKSEMTKLERASRRLGLPIAEILRQGGKMFIQQAKREKAMTTTKGKGGER